MNAIQLAQAVAAGTMTAAQMVEKMTAMANLPIEMKQSKDGLVSISVKGVKGWPTTLTAETWLTLLDCGDDIRSFCDNDELISNAQHAAIKAAKKASK